MNRPLIIATSTLALSLSFPALAGPMSMDMLSIHRDQTETTHSQHYVGSTRAANKYQPIHDSPEPMKAETEIAAFEEVDSQVRWKNLLRRDRIPSR